MTRNPKKNSPFNKVDISLIVVVSLVAFGTLAFSGTLIWLIAAL